MKNSIIGLNLGSLLFILSSLNVYEAGLRFLMVGEIPFINQNIPPEGMFVVLSLAFFGGIVALLPRQLTRKTLEDIKSQTPRLPKRRYTRV
jgi:RsiW-degrading membrane proteinase PrsW (M82 family)